MFSTQVSKDNDEADDTWSEGDDDEPATSSIPSATKSAENAADADAAASEEKKDESADEKEEDVEDEKDKDEDASGVTPKAPAAAEAGLDGLFGGTGTLWLW